ncbi:MAG TPA: SDR family NAD(P)-dependent oxidoreductase, partial [Streptosporangiaceae bacterium]
MTDPRETALWTAVETGDAGALASTLELSDDNERDLVASMLPALSAWRQRIRQQVAVEGWQYRAVWRPVDPAVSRPFPRRLIAVVPAGFAADRRVTATLEALRSRGCAYEVLEVGDADTVVLAARLKSVSGPDTDCDLVLSFLALDERPHPVYPALPTGLALLAALVPALADSGVDAPAWALTFGGADDAGQPSVSPAAAPTWGLGMVAALEQPQRWGGLADLPAEPDPVSLRRLANALRGEEDQLAIRSAGVFARRLVRARAGGGTARRKWQPRGTMLITGGTGGVGAQIARWAARAGAEHLLLVSRRGGDGASGLVTELEELGAAVTVVACDVADRARLAAVIAAIPERWPLRAVVHAAGRGQSSSIADTTLEEAAGIVSAKVAGARNLDDLLGDRRLDAFVLIASNAGVWGGSGLGAYAAANAYLDALAASRRRRGRTATSVAWGSWAGEGLGAVNDTAGRLERLGILAMEPEMAVRALADAVAANETTLSVASVDWARFAPAFTAARPSPLLSELPEVRQALGDSASDSAEAAPGTELAGRIRALAEADRERAVLDTVQRWAAVALGHRDPAAVSPDRAFRDQGVDSMTAVQVRNALTRETGLRLPVTVVFDYPTPRVLARFVLGELAGPGGGGLAEPAAGAGVAAGGVAAGGEPVAVVGMACRLPGGVAGPEDLWELVLAGGEGLSGFPADRGWDVEAIYDPEPGLPGKTYTRRGGFLRGAGDFDPGLFGISPREALGMDPQQRVFLEASWELFERAGIDVTALHGTSTG